MDWKTIEKISKSQGEQWFYNVSQLAKKFDFDRGILTAFLTERSVPHRKIGKAKVYFLPEVMEEIDRTKWK